MHSHTCRSCQLIEADSGSNSLQAQHGLTPPTRAPRRCWPLPTHLELLHLADVADWRDGALAPLIQVHVEQVALRVKLRQHHKRQQAGQRKGSRRQQQQQQKGESNGACCAHSPQGRLP